VTSGLTRAWLVAGAWAAFQWTLTSLPGSALPGVGLSVDKVAHFGLYGVLGALLARIGLLAGWRWRGWLVTLVAVLVIASVDEWHQSLVPGRSAEFADWVSDAAGAATGMVAGRLVGRRWAKVWLA
jgi:VanZ family protein